MSLIDVFRPTSLQEALELKNRYKESKILAGGTDILIKLNKSKEEIKYLLDLCRVDEIKGVTLNDEEIEIGSMVIFNELLESSIIKENYNSLILSAESMGSPQIRNMATIGGNIINAGSAADIIPCIISLNGILKFQSLNSIRTVQCEQYFKDNNNEKIRYDEILISVIIPKKDMKTNFKKLGVRNSLSIARLNIALAINFKEDKTHEITLCLGAVGRFPFRSYIFEQEAKGKDKEWLFSKKALDILEQEVYNSIKNRPTMPFKKEAVKGLYKQMIFEVLDEKYSY